MLFTKLFKKKDKKSRSWNDITLPEFLELLKITESDSTTKDLEIMRVLYGEERGDISFLQSKPKDRVWKNKYKLGDTVYELKADLTRFTTSQFIDYSHAKTPYDYLCVCLIPKGHEYNDGYDMDRCREDFKRILFKDYQSISLFLKRQFQALCLIINDSLNQKKKELMKLTNIKPMDKMKIDLAITEYLSLFQRLLKNLD